MRKKVGEVPRTKENMMAAERRGLPVPRATTATAWVTAQGMKMVIAPSRAGAKMPLLLL